MDQDKILEKLMESNRVPSYVTVEQAKKMIEVMRSGLIHPDKGACDMTLEITVGVPIMEALSKHRPRSESSSIYQKLFDEYRALDSPKTL